MSDEQVTRHRQVPAWTGLALVLLGAVIVRASVLFGTSLMPGTNGAYYLVQVRAVIEKGHLGEHDMPLIFWLQAGLALLVKMVSHLDLEPAIMLASKLFDSIVPALAAVPAFLIAVRWPGSKHSIWTGIATCVLAVLSSGPLVMIGNFQKNALGMVLALWCACFLQQGLARRSWRSIAMAGMFLGLVGVTHIGAFGVTLVLVVLTAIVWTLLISRRRAHALLVIGGGVLGTAGLLGLLMLLGDSSRITKLVSYLKVPLSMFSFTNVADVVRGGQGLPGTGNLPAVVFFGVLAACAVVVLIRQRRDLLSWERALVPSAALLTLFLSSPFLDQDLLSRFSLMAFAPGVILLAFLFAHSRNILTRVTVIAVTLAVVLVSAPSAIRTDSAPFVPETSYAELTSLRAYVSDPSHTLIIAEHGLEWWTAWALHTDVAQPMAVTAADWTTYASVLYLQETGNTRGLGTGVDQMPNGGARPSGGAAFPKPVPPAGTAQGGHGGSGSITLSSDASTLHGGTYFTLSRLPTPVTAQQAVTGGQ